MTRSQLGAALNSILRATSYDMEQAAEDLIRLHTEAGELHAMDQRCRMVLTEVAIAHGITVARLRARNRASSIVDIKNEAAWRCRRLTPQPSYPTIAKAVGWRNHASAVYGERRHEARLRREAEAGK